jgi:biotin carboxylase
VQDPEDGLEKAEKIGWPIMIKASEGGGGKGIRMVSKPENFKQAFGAVQGEVPGKLFISYYIKVVKFVVMCFSSLMLMFIQLHINFQVPPFSS